MSNSSNTILLKIMNDIEQMNNNDLLINIGSYNNKKFSDMFNNCSEKYQIDFIKLLLNKIKLINIDMKNVLPSLRMINTNTINKLKNNIYILIYIIILKKLKINNNIKYIKLINYIKY